MRLILHLRENSACFRMCYFRNRFLEDIILRIKRKITSAAVIQASGFILLGNMLSFGKKGNVAANNKYFSGLWFLNIYSST